MIFFIEYNRREGKIIAFKKFSDSEKTCAENERLEREISLLRSGSDHEVILLEAESEDRLRKTHRRYFENIKQIAESQIQQIR